MISDSGIIFSGIFVFPIRYMSLMLCWLIYSFNSSFLGPSPYIRRTYSVFDISLAFKRYFNPFCTTRFPINITNGFLYLVYSFFLSSLIGLNLFVSTVFGVIWDFSISPSIFKANAFFCNFSLTKYTLSKCFRVYFIRGFVKILLGNILISDPCAVATIFTSL